MTPREFRQALALHPRMDPEGASIKAARLVLVEGVSRNEAARRYRIGAAAVSRAVSRLLAPHCPTCTCHQH